MNLRLLSVVLLAAVLTASCSKFNKVLKSTDYDYKLKMAQEYYDKGKYKQAQTLYEELFPIFKGTPQFEDLYYKYADCAFKQRDYISSENLYNGFLEMFPNSPKAEEVEFQEAFSYYKQSPKPELDQTNTVKAMGMMQTFINTHPGSERNKQAQEIIEKCNKKLEIKELKAAELYFNMGQYRAAAIAYTSLINNYPESLKSDEYKLQIIKSYYKYANLSIQEKREERYIKVIAEVQDFQDRYPESKLLKEAERYLTLSSNNIKSIPK
ncbi:MAG TPA: outer membrane protein assembly factor BamD [Chitinophagaceae bacterium]|nr:outer membrane protein assembly factor BamD [Chitinophagaceae bacterium]